TLRFRPEAPLEGGASPARVPCDRLREEGAPPLAGGAVRPAAREKRVARAPRVPRAARSRGSRAGATRVSRARERGSQERRPGGDGRAAPAAHPAGDRARLGGRGSRAYPHAANMRPGGRRGERMLRELEARRAVYGGGAAERKRTLLRLLSATRLPTARTVLRLHEVLCFLRAWPDDAALLGDVERVLARFSRRRDVARFREDLKDSGIAGTPIVFSFFAPTARWLVRRWPARVGVV